MKFEKITAYDTKLDLGGSCKAARKKAKERHLRVINSRCWDCGTDPKESDEQYFDFNGKNYCYNCYKELKEELADDASLARVLRYKKMREATHIIFDTQLMDLYEYRNYIEYVYREALKGKNLESALEMAAASLLTSKRIKYETQYKVGRYRLDIYIPNLNIALEIDGDRHIVSDDITRDRKIRAYMSEEFEILHIPGRYIQSNLANLVPCMIMAVGKYRKARKEYGNNLSIEKERSLYLMNEVWNRTDKNIKDLIEKDSLMTEFDNF